jgi:outer membrane protein OmpA-like peptidoglycan-associated protein
MFKSFGLFVTCCGILAAQEANPTQKGVLAPADTGQPMPVFRVTVVSRSIKAINYHHRTGSTRVDFRGTELMPAAKGEARVESRMGSTKIECDFDRMEPATKFGPEYLTYVLWAITPEGRANNLGEVVLDGDHSKLLSTTELQAFGLMVTAEPYFSVTQPSDVVVMENFIRNDTTGTIQQVDAKYELLKRGSYSMNQAKFKPVAIDRKGPLQLYEARNAVMIAREVGADRYAQDTLQKALVNLQNAEAFAQSRKGDWRKRTETTAREATQTAEDARIITLRKIEEEHLANERAAAAEREARANAEAEEQARRRSEADAAAAEEARRRAQAESERAAADQARLAAERMKSEAEAAAQKAAEERAAADAARQRALEQQQLAQQEAEKSKLAAEQSDRLRLQAENERTELRQRLLQQLNTILETRDTARGLIVNMSDVLFDTGRYTLRPAAREKLAKISGIVLAHPGLRLEVEGHTDSVGGDAYNQRLSEQRADTVRAYLVGQGINPDTVLARGFGKSMPVASNDTAAGRQQNRRVELVVSGDVIGAQLRSTINNTPATGTTPAPVTGSNPAGITPNPQP